MSRLNKNITHAAALAGCILLAGGTGSAMPEMLAVFRERFRYGYTGDQTTANMTVSDDGTYTRVSG